MEIFHDEADYEYFENLISRALSESPEKSKSGRVSRNFFGSLELHSYCLMPTHFHFLLKQTKAGALKDFMTTLQVSYSMYFNKKYGRKGPLFESRFKAIPVEKTEYLTHLSRYIHLNPLGFRAWDHSSYNDFLYDSRPWVITSFILDLFSTKKHYIAFVDDYRDKDETEDEALEKLFGEI
jgi:REP element-mobilizing transposase RayT